jgi:hypothetical protein
MHRNKSLWLNITFFYGQLQILDGKNVRPANKEISSLGVEDAYRILPIEEGSRSSQSSKREVVNNENKISCKQDALSHGSFAMAGNVARSILRMKNKDKNRIQDGYS